MTGTKGQDGPSIHPTNTNGSSNKPKKQPTTGGGSSSKVKHSKPADLMNITNGIQRLHLGKKGQYQQQQQKTPPVLPASAELEESQSQYQSLHAQSQKMGTPVARTGGKKAAGGRKESDVFAKSELYAGAGFDLSPAASSLPIPRFGKSVGVEMERPSLGSNTGSMRPISVEELLRSGQALSAPVSAHSIPPPMAFNPPQSPLGAGLSEAEQLRIKSEYLMKVFAARDGRPEQKMPMHQQLQPPHRHSLPPNTEQLEEMTAQVRRMLNL